MRVDQGQTPVSKLAGGVGTESQAHLRACTPMTEQSWFDVVEGKVSLYKRIVPQEYHRRSNKVCCPAELLQGCICAFVECWLIKLDKQLLGNIIGDVRWQWLWIWSVNYFARHDDVQYVCI